MPRSSSWMPYVPQGVKGFDDDDDDDDDVDQPYAFQLLIQPRIL